MKRSFRRAGAAVLACAVVASVAAAASPDRLEWVDDRGAPLWSVPLDPPPGPAGVPLTARTWFPPLPEITIARLDGGKLEPTRPDGDVLVLAFWATWCQPCLAEIPALEAIEAKHPGRVVAVSLDEGGEEDVRRFLDKRPLPYRVLLGDAELFARYDGMGIPHTIVLDRELKVVAVHRGAVGRKALERELASL